MASFKVTETRRQRTTRTGFGATNNRSTFGYWVPLVLTVTAATVGIAAWIWSERDSEEDESSSEEQGPGGVRPPGYTNMSGGLPPGPGPSGYQGPPQPEWQGGQPPVAGGFQGPPGQGGFPGPFQGGFQDSREVDTRTTTVEQTGETGLVARMSNVLGIQRAPSPGQAYNWASRNISAGVAAAGAAVGGAINSFTDESKEGFDEHERWSEEAEQQQSNRSVDQRPQPGLKRRGTAEEFYSGSVSLPRSASIPSHKRKTVALVVSSVQRGPGNDEDDIDGHSSILAHLPSHINPETTRIFVLIYAPTLDTHPLSPSATTRRPSQSMTSSYSNISTTEATTPGSFTQDQEDEDDPLHNLPPKPIDESTTTLYKSLHNQALPLVDKDTMIIPFSSPQGHKHIIKSLQPEIAYMQESTCGHEGEIVSELSGWVRTCVVVIGDEGGTGGLVDTDDEFEKRSGSKSNNGGGQVWWKREDRTGLGRGVEIVEALKIGEDWRRRVNGED